METDNRSNETLEVIIRTSLALTLSEMGSDGGFQQRRDNLVDLQELFIY